MDPPPFKHILCAVDGSRGSDVAVEQALTLAGPAGVTFIAITDARGAGAMRMATLGPQRAQEALARAELAAKAAGVGTSTILRHAPDVRDALLDHALHYDLLVLGTHGAKRRAGVLVGDLAATALHRSPIPVLLARPAPYRCEFPTRLLLAADGSRVMHKAGEVTADIARRHGARVTIVHAGSTTPAVDRDIAEIQALVSRRTGSAAELVEAAGDAPSAIAGLAHELSASLVVTGSRMLTGIHALRSVSERVGQMAPCSVLVLRG